MWTYLPKVVSATVPVSLHYQVNKKDFGLIISKVVVLCIKQWTHTFHSCEYIYMKITDYMHQICTHFAYHRVPMHSCDKTELRSGLCAKAKKKSSFLVSDLHFLHLLTHSSASNHNQSHPFIINLMIIQFPRRECAVTCAIWSFIRFHKCHQLALMYFCIAYQPFCLFIINCTLSDK